MLVSSSSTLYFVDQNALLEFAISEENFVIFIYTPVSIKWVFSTNN